MSITLAVATQRDKNGLPPEDPGPPYLLFDCYPGDRGALPDFADAARTDTDGDGDSDVVGGILKATDGVAYGYTQWFAKNAPRVEGLVGGYHYFQALQDPVVQANFYLSVMASALGSGWAGDRRVIMPIVDAEFGDERSANRRASKQQWVDGVSKYADRVRSVTGRRVMLYGRGLMRDLGIAVRMGCDCVWNPAYTDPMALNGITFVRNEHETIEKTEWTLDDVALWQYGGDGTAAYKKLPSAIMGLGKIDLSVFTDGARPCTMASLVRRLI